MRDGKFRRFTTADGLAGSIVRVIHEDSDGVLWIGTNDGLSQWRNGKFSNFSTANGFSAHQVPSLYEDREHNLWIGTDGGGLNRLKNGKFTAYTTQQGLFSDSIFEILEDDRRNLWMSCFSGVFCVKKKDLDDFDRGKIQTVPCASYGKSEGMSSVQCNGVSKPAGWRGKDGRLWFPTTRGVVVVDPNSIRENDSLPPVFVENIVADKKNLTPSNTLTIPPGKGDLEFHYTALSFCAAEKNRFKYKLEGVDSGWVDAGTRRIAYYNNIKPGPYTFRVVGCNNDGVWNETGASIAFVLLPHFSQTKWFFGLIGMVMIGFVAGAARYITWKKVQRTFRRLEQQHAVEKERARIAQDMHDDLGARLTEIMFLGGLAENSKDAGPQIRGHVAHISHAARELVQNLDAIVWAVDPKNDTLDNLATYIHLYADRFLKNSGIQRHFQIQNGLPPRAIPSQVRHSLFLVVKEALNNIAKHAGCTEVRFDLRIENDSLAVIIVDNGKGFSREAISEPGNGLQNMEERIKRIGGHFEMSSQPGKGTRIQLKIPLDQLPLK